MKRSLLIICIALALCAVVFYGNMTGFVSGLIAGVGTETQEEDSGNTQNPTVDNNSQAPESDDKDNLDDSNVGDAGNIVTLTSLDVMYGALANEIIIGDNSDFSAILPANVKIASGATSLELTVSPIEADGSVTVKDGDILTSLDVHIEGISHDNSVPMLVKLGPVLAAGLKETEIKLFHTENGVAIPMTRVGTINNFEIHNQYTYDALTGEVCIFVASFSVFSAVQTSASVWDGESSDTSWYDEGASEFVLEDAADFIGFRNLVDAGTTFEGKTVKLGVDIDLNNALFDPIGFGYTCDIYTEGKDQNTAFMGIFDGQNHTVYNLYQNGWDLDEDKVNYSTYTYNTAGGGLFASIENATVKNLAVSGANIVFECIDMGIVVGLAQGTCHFENIVVTNSKIANYNRSTGGVVGEVCFGPYGTDTAKGYSHTFENITVDSSVKVSSLWGSFDTSCGGVIGGKWHGATVKMENVTVAAELDVFSDVTAAYQWYAYRRCGMLIGNTEQSSPKKAENAAANFLICKNVNVYYGDWVNYTYYEYENQDSGTGRNYPWVRAEAGEHNEAFSNPRYGVPTHDGEKVNGLDHATDYTPIVFGQLYGGGQGVYGCAEHVGVTVTNKISKEVYIDNNTGWENLKLYYWYKHGNDAWTTVVDGIDISDMETAAAGVYKISIPAYAHGFKIVADGGKECEFLVKNIAEDKRYYIQKDVIIPTSGSVKLEMETLDLSNSTIDTEDSLISSVGAGNVCVDVDRIYGYVPDTTIFRANVAVNAPCNIKISLCTWGGETALNTHTYKFGDIVINYEVVDVPTTEGAITLIGMVGVTEAGVYLFEFGGCTDFDYVLFEVEYDITIPDSGSIKLEMETFDLSKSDIETRQDFIDNGILPGNVRVDVDRIYGYVPDTTIFRANVAVTAPCNIKISLCTWGGETTLNAHTYKFGDTVINYEGAAIPGVNGVATIGTVGIVEAGSYLFEFGGCTDFDYVLFEVEYDITIPGSGSIKLEMEDLDLSKSDVETKKAFIDAGLSPGEVQIQQGRIFGYASGVTVFRALVEITASCNVKISLCTWGGTAPLYTHTYKLGDTVIDCETTIAPQATGTVSVIGAVEVTESGVYLFEFGGCNDFDYVLFEIVD